MATSAQQSPVPAPQTARQALMEMFGKTPGTFIKHLPAVTRTALEKAGVMPTLQLYSSMASQFHTQGNTLQTFETGPVLLATEDPKTGQKTEVTVEKDELRGDRDDIELSFRVYKNGVARPASFMPHITFSMKREEQVWTLNEISLTLHLPLTDPDLLKAITEKMKTPATSSPSSNISFTPRSETAAQTTGSDATVLAAMRTILTAEATYFNSYSNIGYTCTLSDLDGFGGGEPNEHQAMLITSGLASGKRYGYVFNLSGCNSAPATSFRLTAAPNANTFGRKAFCADQSGTIRSSENGNPESCLMGGSPLQ
jgi:hypothetical protein